MNNASTKLRVIPRESIKKRLIDIIKKKRNLLRTLTTKHELFVLQLDLVKREYNYRVGSLLTRDNQLDVDIIQHKRVLEYIRSGISYKEAIDKLRSTNWIDNEEFIAGEESMYAEEILRKTLDTKDENIEKKNIRQIWKEAVMKFHPDLSTSEADRKYREDIMKKINKAYSENDIESLTNLLKMNKQIEPEDASVSELEKLLIDLESMIVKIRQEIGNLKKTEWYGWSKKIASAKLKGLDVFKELEYSLLEDIAKKTKILEKLKLQVESSSK